MNRGTYESLIRRFKTGEFGAIPESELKTLDDWSRQVHLHLTHFNRRDWKAFATIEADAASPPYREVRGDFLYLLGNAAFIQADYAAASRFYQAALDAITPDCLLYSADLVGYNQYVTRTFNPDFRFRNEIPLLSRLRHSARRSGDFFLAGLILNSYGNHYYDRGRFRRAYALYRKALKNHEQGSKLPNLLDAMANCVRAALQIGNFSEAERLVQAMNARILKAGDTFGKERFDRVYAEYLAATECHEESLTHLEFSMNPSAAFETARMTCLKAEVLLETGRAGALELLKQVEQFIVEHHLPETSFIGLYSTLASVQMEMGDLAGAYRSILKAETLAFSHHDSHLRAQVMLQKARLNRFQGRLDTAAQLMIDVLQLSRDQGFVLLALQALRNLAREELLPVIHSAARKAVLDAIHTQRLESHAGGKAFRRSREAVAWLKGHLEKTSEPVSQSGSGHAVLEIDTVEGSIVVRTAEKSESLMRTHRLTGKLLLEFLAAPNADLSLDQLHLKLWGGPVRNESHVQKLKTLVSRLRSELHEKKFPGEIESREYATYRLVCNLPVTKTG